MVKITLFFVLLLNFSAYAKEDIKKRIFILHSYSQEYGWTKSQHDAFVSKLEAVCPSPLEVSVEYLDTKRLTFSEEYQRFFSDYLRKKYKNYSPDAIYVTDDNALKFFLGYRETLFSNSPLFFSGVNDLKLLDLLDPQKYKGVFETKDIIPNIELIRQFSPQTRDIWIVGDDSITYRSIEADIKSHLQQYSKYTFHFVASSRIEDIMAKLPKSRKSFVLLTTIGGLSDRNGRTMTLQESIGRLRENKNLILCSMEDAYVFGGVIGGYVTSGTLHGERAAELAIRHLQGTPLREIQSVVKSPNTYMFDRNALVESRLILSEYTARDAIILHEEKTFFERYQETILNVVFIFVIFFLLFMVIVFFIAVQKNDQLKKLQRDLEERSDELATLKERVNSSDDSDE